MFQGGQERRGWDYIPCRGKAGRVGPEGTKDLDGGLMARLRQLALILSVPEQL